MPSKHDSFQPYFAAETNGESWFKAQGESDDVEVVATMNRVYCRGNAAVTAGEVWAGCATVGKILWIGLSYTRGVLAWNKQRGRECARPTIATGDFSNLERGLLTMVDTLSATETYQLLTMVDKLPIRSFRVSLSFAYQLMMMNFQPPPSSSFTQSNTRLTPMIQHHRTDDSLTRNTIFSFHPLSWKTVSCLCI